MSWDIIGDIHGYADPLERLLGRLGYEESSSGFRHPDGRRVLFLGDLVDRGPAMPRVIRIVRSMVDAGQADIILGNHELNLVAMTRVGPDGTPFRAHKANRMKDYCHTCAALGDELESTCDWFCRLPVCFEGDGFRAVHAAWIPNDLALIEQARGGHRNPIDDDILTTMFDSETELFAATERVLKGCEVELPEGVSFRDFGGHRRTAARVQWYRRPSGEDTIADWAMPPGSIDCDAPAAGLADAVPGYGPAEPPCFVGHYWLTGTPAPLLPNVACLDYGVARGPEKGGDHPPILAAYRFDGEQILDPAKFVSVPGRS